MGRGRGAMAGAGPDLAIAGPDGRVVASRSGELIGERLPSSVLAQGLPLALDGRTVGTLLALRSADVALDALGQSFLSQVRASLAWAALLAAALSLALGIAISRLLTAPLGRLTRAAGAVAAGDLSQRVDVRSHDEIGELGSAFNGMTASLAEAEALRKNLMADVAHELRTPLTVVQGNLQAILDGVYPLEMAQVHTLYDETRLLARLVDDLHDLALADAGQLRLERAPVDLAVLARTAVGHFAPGAEAAGVALELAAEEHTPEVIGDAGRLAQVLRNLLSNALRHTPAHGEIRLSAARSGESVEMRVSDTGPGIAPEDLPHVFERFYRADRSRTRESGGSGLGLAIARSIVASHGGTIAAESRPGQGTTIVIRLPLGDRATRGEGSPA